MSLQSNRRSHLHAPPPLLLTFSFFLLCSIWFAICLAPRGGEAKVREVGCGFRVVLVDGEVVEGARALVDNPNLQRIDTITFVGSSFQLPRTTTMVLRGI
ncbi:hypothetical protein Tsubulata_020480 [Turnera subulata]|uniref:Uncharacterized protein n=1 Tax=Turnera subulata TaxID=218843 RepID=A0A9Q0F493_9ROSI|nr:hypothetical protein Tsubulata_020480 [Turnera subulata]